MASKRRRDDDSEASGSEESDAGRVEEQPESEGELMALEETAAPAKPTRPTRAAASRAAKTAAAKTAAAAKRAGASAADEDEDGEGEMDEEDEEEKPKRATRGRAAARGGKAAPAARRKSAASAKADEEEDEDEDEEEAPKTRRKAPAKKAATPAAKKATPAKGKAAAKPAAKRGRKAADAEEGSEGEGGAAAGGGGEVEEDAAAAAAETLRKKGKGLKPMELLELAMKAHKWWEAPEHAADIKWGSMEHCGVIFPPAYKPHGVKMRYEGKEVDLTPAQEEMATFYSSVAKDAPQLANAKTAKVFNRNFFKEFQRVLGPGHPIQKFEGCDFDPIRAHLKAQSEAKKAATKEEKEKAKEEKTGLALKYGFALVDGHLERMGNYNVEPPGLFRGRGEHPLMGVLKRRILPEDITLNVAKTAVVPACPMPGHSWKRIVHEPGVTWLAAWQDPVGDHKKYVFLAASSAFKGRADLAKYEKARRLKLHIDHIRAFYEKLLKSDDMFERQSGTAMWIIDRLALRVGGEKDEDEADTVGCCSLRVEHLTFPDDSSEKKVTFDFLGKDSMRYYNTVDFTRWGDVGVAVHSNLRRLCKGKKSDEDIFDQLTPDRLNEQLNALMKGLSAKVFRTYNASITLQQQLADLALDTPAGEKVLEYNRANREVAILCNHQRSVPKTFQAAYEKLEARHRMLKAQLEELQGMKETLEDAAGKAKGQGKKAAPEGGITLRREDSVLEAEAEKAVEEELAKAAAAAGAEGAGAGAAAGGGGGSGGKAAPTREDLLKAALRRLKEEEAHRFTREPDVDAVETRMSSWRDKLEKLEMEMRNKDENKAVALGTSKINYMDPRITVAWCKKVELPIEKVFPRTLRDKFPWAMNAPSTFVW